MNSLTAEALEICKIPLKLSPGFPKLESFTVNLIVAVGILPVKIVSNVEFTFMLDKELLRPLPLIIMTVMKLLMTLQLGQKAIHLKSM